MQLRAWPIVLALVVAGWVTFLNVEDRAPRAAALSLAPERHPADVAGSDVTRPDGLSDLGPSHVRTAPNEAREASQPALLRSVPQHVLVSITDRDGAPIPGAKLDVEARGATTAGAAGDVTLADDTHPRTVTHGLAAGNGEVITVSVMESRSSVSANPSARRGARECFSAFPLVEAPRCGLAHTSCD